MAAAPLSQFAVHLRPEDNIAVARKPIPAGTELQVNGHGVTLPSAVRMGHKFAVGLIKEGDPIRKYGQIIGFAGRNVAEGEHVHVHNVKLGAFERDYAYATQVPAPLPPPAEYRTFKGFDRGAGKPDHLRYGTRNYLAVISTVNCSASTSKYIADRVREAGLLKNFPNVDGIVAIVHRQGCAMQYDGPDHKQLDRTLAGFARHPNVGAYILVGLGCEIVQASHLIESEKLNLIQLNGAKSTPLALSIQECGGIGKTVEAGVQAVADLLPRVNDIRRVQLPAKHIILGTNCGGSDGNSGVTANPALGVASDLLVACGATSVLAETTEIYGGEHTLTRRAISREVGEKLLERIRWWERHTAMFGVQINNNPSVGNKKGGLTTIYEKSLGAIAKGGTTALRDVFLYAEPIRTRGFVVMDTPGFDPVSVTGLVAGGCNMVVFTTGRGSCYGCKPVPSIKVATNTPMYERMEADMDINAGVILDGVPVEDVGRQIFDKILSVASGEKTKSELQGIGDEEFAPWNIGPTL